MHREVPEATVNGDMDRFGFGHPGHGPRMGLMGGQAAAGFTDACIP